MKLVTTLGLVVVLLGILGFIFPDLSYTHQKAVIDVGPISAIVNESTLVHIPHYVSALIILFGLAVFSIGYFRYTKGKS